MGLYEGRGNLAKGFKDLQLRWQSTKQDWNDPVSIGFEKNYLEPLEMALRQALSAMDQTAQSLAKVRGDCE